MKLSEGVATACHPFAFKFWKVAVPQEDHCFGWTTLAGSECPFSARRRIKRRLYYGFFDDRVRPVLWGYRSGCADGGCNCWWKRAQELLVCIVFFKGRESIHEHSVQPKKNSSATLFELYESAAMDFGEQPMCVVAIR